MFWYQLSQFSFSFQLNCGDYTESFQSSFLLQYNQFGLEQAKVLSLFTLQFLLLLSIYFIKMFDYSFIARKVYSLKVPKILKFSLCILFKIESMRLMVWLTIIQLMFKYQDNIQTNFYLQQRFDIYYLVNTMRIFLISLCLITIALCKNKNNKKQEVASNKAPIVLKETEVRFIIEQSIQSVNQILKISMKLGKSDPSLQDSIEQANELEADIKYIFVAYCLQHKEATNQIQCLKAIQVGEYEIKAEYYHLRGNELFKTFNVQFQIQMTINHPDQFGQLIDEFSDMIDDGDIIMSSLGWQDETETKKEEQILGEGVVKAKQSCKNLGMSFVKIKSVEVWEKPKDEEKKKPKKHEQPQQDQEEEEQEQQQPQQSEQEPQEQKLKYKFVAICREPKPKKVLKAAVVNKKNEKKAKKNNSK